MSPGCTCWRKLRESPPRIETSLEPCQQSLRLERIPGGQLVAGDGRAGWEQEGQLLRFPRDLAAVDVAQHHNVAEREGITAGMATFLLHQHARLRVPAALIHQSQHISARLTKRMRDNRGSTTPGDRDYVGVDGAARQLGEPPVLHFDDEYADLRKDRDQIRITPAHHRLVIDEAIVWKPRKRREDAPLAGRARRRQRVWDHLRHGISQCHLLGLMSSSRRQLRHPLRCTVLIVVTFPTSRIGYDPPRARGYWYKIAVWRAPASSHRIAGNRHDDVPG